MKLKVGDKVRIVKFPNQWMVGQIGEVCALYPENALYPYRIKTIPTWNCLVKQDEIESYLKKGQQLLFPFMEEQ